MRSLSEQVCCMKCCSCALIILTIANQQGLQKSEDPAGLAALHRLPITCIHVSSLTLTCIHFVLFWNARAAYATMSCILLARPRFAMSHHPVSFYASLCNAALCKWIRVLLAVLPLLLVQSLHDCARTAVYTKCAMNAVDQSPMLGCQCQ